MSKKKIIKNQFDYLEEAKESLADLGSNLMVDDLKLEWENEKSGMGSDINRYLRACEEANNWIMEEPDILDEYSIRISEKEGKDYDKYSKKVMEAVEKVIWFRANPWRVLSDVVGYKRMNKATVAGNRIRTFYPFQKRYLRDVLDPRVPRLIFTACRGGAKTWLTAMAGFIEVYTNPRVGLMIISGSQDQSINMYRYYSTVAEGSPFMRLVKRGRFLKRRTETIAGGWIEAFPASEKRTHGPRPDKVFIDEACKGETEHIMGSISAAMTSQSIKFVYSSTPDKMVHVFTDYLREATRQENMTPAELEQIPRYLRWKKYQLSAFECPWIPNENIKLLTNTYGGVDSHLYKINVLGQPAPAEGAVYSGSAIMKRIINSIPETVTITTPEGEQVQQDTVLHSYTVGMDMGGKHPSAIVKVAEDQAGNCYVVHDEEDTSGLQNQVVRKTVECAIKDNAHVYLDAAPVQYHANREIRYALNPHHLPAQVVAFSKNKMAIVNHIRGFLEDDEGPNVYFIKGSSEKLVNELLEYSYDENARDEKPKKGNDDHIDAFLVSMHGHRYKFLDEKYYKQSGSIHDMGELLDRELNDPFPD
jgi:hypothetical protein